MKEKLTIASKEKEPGHARLVVDFLRHGQSLYSEQGRDLTPAGEKQVIASAQTIIEKIDPAKEKVILLSSPAVRAQGSEEIIRTLLKERGIEVYHKGIVGSMRNLDLGDKVHFEELLNDAKKNNKSVELLYSREQKYQNPGVGFETASQVRKRAERVFNWLRYLAEQAQKNDKVIHIIGVSHFEFLNPIVEDIFGLNVEAGKGINYGEDLEVNFDFNKETQELIVSARFRGEQKTNIVFDKKNRKFISKKANANSL